MESIHLYLTDHAAVERDARFCSIDEQSARPLRQAAEEILKRPDLLDDLALIDQALTSDHACWNEAPWRKYTRQGTLGETFLLAFPILHHVESIRAYYNERGIPERYLRAVMSDLQRWLETHRQRAGTPGFSEIGWIREHVCARIFEIGRLQFQPGLWNIPVTAIVHKKTGERLLVAKADGETITSDGGYGSAAGARQEGLVPLHYKESENGIEGHRLTAKGRISRDLERFPHDDWELLVAPGSPVINLHIPCGSPLAPQACRDSVREALRFFPTYFPDWPIARAKAMVCVSWLLYPDFQEILSPKSDIVGFQRLFHPFPVPRMGDHQFYERAFVPWGRAATRDKLTTSLQFALFDHIQAGHTPLEGGGVLFTDEISSNA